MDEAYLLIDYWNDYSFVTMFYLAVFDSEGVMHEIGNVKIGFVDQAIETSTYTTLNGGFQRLGGNYFSLGESVDYYSNLMKVEPEPLRTDVLVGLRDVVYSDDALISARDQEVFSTSLLRTVSVAAIQNQFSRVLGGGAVLTDYEFRYRRDADNRYSGITLDFDVQAGSKPSTNIHVIIGRNGVGKTTVLNDMVLSVIDQEHPGPGSFESWMGAAYTPIGEGYFTTVVSAAFSPFDPFSPPDDQPDPALGICYHYIGLKRREEGIEAPLLKKFSELTIEFVDSLDAVLGHNASRLRWLAAIETLDSDENFAEMRLERLANLDDPKELPEIAERFFTRMSSGHAAVLLTVTKLVSLVEEKALVLIDEPESHLHPPLLSAFIRALSELLQNRNAVAIVASHSPVVLQEIPRSCASIMIRAGLEAGVHRPELETFGENVGTLTREVFGLEVAKSGFLRLLTESVETGHGFEDILNEYGQSLGFEGRALLRALVNQRDQVGEDG
ncbi:MAG: AAA family ATPase [Halieaceae bacterium]